MDNKRKAISKSRPVIEPAGEHLMKPGKNSVHLLIYSHDTFGLGHIRRCLKIARALKTRFPQVSILLITGSPQVHRFPLPRGVDYLKLPSVLKTGAEKYESRSLGLGAQQIRNLRAALISAAVQYFVPDILLVDHSPLGMNQEIREVLEWLFTNRPQSFRVIGLRDILDTPEQVITTWEQQNIYQVLERLYTHILVYGDPAVFNPAEAYRFPESLLKKTRFCGYIVDSVVADDSNHLNRSIAKRNARRILITIGGGDDGAEIITTYLTMLKDYPRKLSLSTTILTGPFVLEQNRQQFRRLAQGQDVQIRNFVSDPGPLLRRTDLVISMGGYNSLTEILASARKALIIPRTRPRQEQLLRAERLKKLGLVEVLRPEQLTPSRLNQVVNRLLQNVSAPLSAARQKAILPLNGLERLTEFFDELLELRPGR